MKKTYQSNLIRENVETYFLLSIFGGPHTKKKKKKKRKYKTIVGREKISMRKGYQDAKKIDKDWLRRFKNTNIKI
jgi:hypothetical protein